MMRAHMEARMIRRLFLDHPESVGESYGAHMRAAGGFGLALIGAGLACIVHGLLPFLFTRTGSDAVRRMHARLEGRCALAATRAGQRPAAGHGAAAESALG